MRKWLSAVCALDRSCDRRRLLFDRQGKRMQELEVREPGASLGHGARLVGSALTAMRPVVAEIGIFSACATC